MWTRCETKQNAKLQKEFQVTRYIWTFAEQWCTAKKADLLAILWVGLREQLQKYNQRNPSGQQIPPPIRPDATTPSRPALEVLSPLPLPKPVTPVAGSSRTPL